MGNLIGSGQSDRGMGNLTGADNTDKIWMSTVYRCLPTGMTIFVRPEGIESLQCS